MIYTFGHSTYDEQQARQVLHGIDILIDIRSHPTSKWEQWRQEELESWVPAAGIDYVWLPSLGGWDVRHAGLAEEMAQYGMDVEPYTKGFFPKGRIAKKLKIPTPAWTVAGFWDYQWFMTLPEFAGGVVDLMELGADKNVAIMCGELIPWSCHRSMVSDYLLHFYNLDAKHLQPKLHPHSDWKSRMDRYDPRAMELMQRLV